MVAPEILPPVMTGVVSVGEVAKTAAPVPVSSVSAVRRFALEGVAKKVATPDPRPLTPVAIGRPVAFVSVALEGVPSAGVTSVGLVANTSDPVPVSLVTAAIKLALVGVAKNVATPVPSPLMPVATGRPVPFVRVTTDGVPRLGVVRTGEVAKTNAPEPVSSETAVARFALDGVARNVATPAANPLTPVEIGRPVAFVRTADDGVPNAGVTRTGDVANTRDPEPVSFVTRDARFAEVGVATNASNPAARVTRPQLVISASMPAIAAFTKAVVAI